MHTHKHTQEYYETWILFIQQFCNERNSEKLGNSMYTSDEQQYKDKKGKYW